jgi:hypothetical protein
MKILRVFLFLTFSIILNSSTSPTITTEVRLIKKFKVDLVDQNGTMEFLKFKTLETNNIFLTSPDYENHSKKFFKKNRVYKVTYAEGGLWGAFEGESKLVSNKDLEKYPFHFLIDIKNTD